MDDACGPWQERIAAVAQPTDAASLAAWLEKILPLVRKQIGAVKAVKPPVKDDEARKARLFIGSLQQLEAALTRYRAAIRANKPAAIQQALEEANAAGAAARSYAVSLDITQCGGYEGS